MKGLAALSGSPHTRWCDTTSNEQQCVPANTPVTVQGFKAAHPGFNATDLFVEDGIYKWDNSLYAGAPAAHPASLHVIW